MSVHGEDITQQDANTSEESSAPQQESTDSQSTESQADASQAASSQPKEQVPFHEDPRIRDYIERQVARSTETYERKFQEFQRQQQEQFRAREQAQTPKQRHPFVEQLSTIDPKYAEYFEQLENQVSKSQVLEQQLQQMERQRVITEYESSVSRLANEHKVPAELQPMVKEHMDALALSGQINDLKQLPNVYKAVAEKYTKLIEGVKRTERASYVTDKSKDASAPTSQPKGKTPSTRNDKGQFTGDWESDRALIVSRALKRAKASSDL